MKTQSGLSSSPTSRPFLLRHTTSPLPASAFLPRSTTTCTCLPLSPYPVVSCARSQNSDCARTLSSVVALGVLAVMGKHAHHARVMNNEPTLAHIPRMCRWLWTHTTAATSTPRCLPVALPAQSPSCHRLHTPRMVAARRAPTWSATMASTTISRLLSLLPILAAPPTM